MGFLRDLIIRIKGDKSQLDSTLSGASNNVQSFAGKVSGFIKAGFGIGAVIAFGKAVIESTKGLSDKVSIIMAGIKESMEELFQAFANLDFSNLINNLIDGYKRAVTLKKELILLADIKAYDDYIQQIQKARSAELQEVMRDTDQEKTVRLAAGDERLKIEEDIQKRSLKLAQEFFNVKKKAWEDDAKISGDIMIESFERIQKMAPELKSRLETAFSDVTKAELGDVKAASKIVKSRLGYDKLEGVSQEDINAYADYFQLQTKDKDALIDLFNLHTDLNTVKTEGQLRYNAVLRETNRLESSLKDKYSPGKETYSPDLTQKMQGLGLPSLSDLKSGSRGASQNAVMGILGITNVKLIDTGESKMVKAIEKTNKDIYDAGKKLEGILTDMRDQTVDIALQLVEGLGEALGGGNMQDIGKNLLLSFANFLSLFGKLLVTYALGAAGFWKTLETGGLTWPIALAAGTAMILAAGLIKGALSHASQTVSSGMGGGGTSGAAMATQNLRIVIDGKIDGRDIALSNRRYLDEESRGT